ncbi:MAG: hypothetical protein HY873_03700 [Chloroflexi bacterium]|nr:hypothetical protein [Chloroflexota bacterium]
MLDNHRDSVQQLNLALDEIDAGVARYLNGGRSAYQSVAVQLRKLLLTGRRGLLVQMIPQPTFHAFTDLPELIPPEPGLEPVVFLARVRFFPTKVGGYMFELDLNEDKDPLPLESWLDEWILRPPQLGTKGIMIRRLIADTANEEGAHSERQYGELLQRMRGYVAVRNEITRGEHDMAVVAIGKYVSQRVRAMMAAAL